MNNEAIGILLILIGVGVMGLYLITVTSNVAPGYIPSEELCQRIIGYSSQQIEFGEKYWCEYNETGWHFNKTKMLEAFNGTLV